LFRAAQHASTAAIVEQSVDRFLEHALFIPNNDVGRVQFDQLLQPVVAVDHAAIEVIEIGRSKTSAIQRHKRTQFRRDHWDHI